MLVWLLLCLLPLTLSFSIPVWKVKGTHYEVGVQVGKHFSTRIKEYVQKSDELNKILLPFSQTSQGRSIVERFVMVNQRAYPDYFEEIQAGSGVPLSILFLLQFADELEAGWIPSSELPKSNCADIHVLGSNVLVGHNEDTEPIIKTTAYIVDYEFTDTGEHFVAYTYPGRLPGDAWAFSPKANLTFSMNWVGPLPVTVGLARGFINRSILGAKSRRDAIERATPDNRSFGFALNLGDISALRSFSIEIAPPVYSIFEVSRNYSHFNLYKELAIEQQDDESTHHRQARGILGDTKDPQFPIYRVATKFDPLDTAVTVIFDLVNKHASVWDNNPKLNPPGILIPLN